MHQDTSLKILETRKHFLTKNGGAFSDVAIGGRKMLF